MERMTRNGLLILIAVLTVFALPLCLKNDALAQINYLPDVYSDPVTGFPIDLGANVTISVGPNGSFISGYENEFYDNVWLGALTSGQYYTVFQNAERYYYYASSITALSGSAAISTYSTNPAIQNGISTQRIGEIERVYALRVSLGMAGFSYILEYGYYYLNANGTVDLDTGFTRCTYDQLPGDIQELVYPEGGPNAGDNVWPEEGNGGYTTMRRTIGTSNFYTLLGTYPYIGDIETALQALPQGQSITFLNGNAPLPTDLSTSLPLSGWERMPNMIPFQHRTVGEDGTPLVADGAITRDYGNRDWYENLEAALVFIGSAQRGNLVINDRDPLGVNQFNGRGGRAPRLFTGDERTLIASNGTAIENVGNLTIYDSRIETGTSYFSIEYGTAGISHEYLRTLNAVYSRGDNPELIAAYYSTPSSGYHDLFLYNTQIGRPTAPASYYYYDPYTGEYYYSGEYLNSFGSMYGVYDPNAWYYLSDPYLMTFAPAPPSFIPPSSIGIALDGVGTPIQTISVIPSGSAILGGRIYAGQTTTMARSPIGQIVSVHPNTNATAQQYVSYLDYISGPAIGIHAFMTSRANVGQRGLRSLNERQEDVYSAYGWREGNTTRGRTDVYTSSSVAASPSTSLIYNRIELLDNTWIFAQTGISFGGGAPTSGGISLLVDSTSGIYSLGDGYLLTYLPDNLPSSSSENRNHAYGNAGITDRYSLLELWAVTGGEEPSRVRVDGSAGYSGTNHEIMIRGKVISAAPRTSGVTFNPSIVLTLDMSDNELRNYRNLYYYDPKDPDSVNGYVYYYDSNRTDADNSRIAAKFVAFDNQPGRTFWLRRADGTSVPLTHYDYAAQRWTLHPDAPTIAHGNSTAFFVPFNSSSGLGIDIVGTSMAYEGTIDGTWSTYYGPTVRLLSVLGNDALVVGGEAYSDGAFYSGGQVRPNFWNSSIAGGAAMSFGHASHVSRVVIGSNNDVANLSNVLFRPDDPILSAHNFRAFDTMTSADRGKFLYDRLLAFDDDPEKFHFDNAGVYGDIISQYNTVVTVWSGTGGSWSVDGTWTGGSYSVYDPGVLYDWTMDLFWRHRHGEDTVGYYNEVLGISSTDGPSFLIGHRDSISTSSDFRYSGDTADDIEGRSLVLDEILLYFLAARQFEYNVIGNLGGTVLRDSYGIADNPRHFREALARLIHYGTAEIHTGLTVEELLAGYTRDGTLLVFTSGDIFSGNIYGGGVGDPLGGYYHRILRNNSTGDSDTSYGVTSLSNFGSGNIDLRFTNGTTIFNRNILEYVDGSNIFRDAGIRVRDVYVESTGHLLMNDAVFAVNPFTNYYADGNGANFEASRDYADRLIIHDVYSEGIVSGNGTFQIAQRYDGNDHFSYFVGYFVNRGILAPGLPGFIGTNMEQAYNIERTAYRDMLSRLSNSASDIDWNMRGVPGGQFGSIRIHGSLRLMDEYTRVVFDSEGWDFNTPSDYLPAGEYHVTVGNDTIGGTFGKYAVEIAYAPSAFDPVTLQYNKSQLQSGALSKEDWQVIATEKLGTHLAWFSPSKYVDSKGLPLLTPYEQFEYLTTNDPARRNQLEHKLMAAGLTRQEIQLTALDHLLMRFGFSDVISVHGTVPPYIYALSGWEVGMYGLGAKPTNVDTSQYLGITHLGGIFQVDEILDLDDNANDKEKLASYIVIASEGYTDGTVKRVTSATSNWIFANISTMPSLQLASGQIPTVLTVVDDPHYYFNRVSRGGGSYNALSIARVLDDSMFTDPGLAMAFQFGLNSPGVLHDALRAMANSTRANSIVMNLASPSDHLFNQIGYGTGGLSTGKRGDIVFHNMQTGQLQQPYGQPAVPPPGNQFTPRGQSPFYRTGSIWGAFTHTNFTMDDDGNSYKYTFFRNGGMIGNEWNLTPSSVLGGVFTFNQGELKSLSDRVDSTDYGFGLYFVAAPFEQFELKSYVGGGYQSYEMDRYIRNGDIALGSYVPGNIFGIDEHYNAETSGHTFDAAIEFARPFKVSPNFVIRPAAGLEYQTIQQKAYSDRQDMFASGASWSLDTPTNIAGATPITGSPSGTFAMDYEKMTFSRSLVRFGINTESYFARGGWRFRAYHVGRLTGERMPVSTQSFGGSRVFSTRGADLGSSYCQVGIGSHWWLDNARTASLFMNADWNFSMNGTGFSMIHANIGVQRSF